MGLVAQEVRCRAGPDELGSVGQAHQGPVERPGLRYPGRPTVAKQAQWFLRERARLDRPRAAPAR